MANSSKKIWDEKTRSCFDKEYSCFLCDIEISICGYSEIVSLMERFCLVYQYETYLYGICCTLLLSDIIGIINYVIHIS